VNPTCPYCSRPSRRVTGVDLYPHRADLADKFFYRCLPCDAMVGCHPGTDKSLGRLANAELRHWKMRAHAAFDPHWKNGEMSRKAAYKRLADRLGISEEVCHIGMMDVAMCQRVVRLCTPR